MVSQPGMSELPSIVECMSSIWRMKSARVLQIPRPPIQTSMFPCYSVWPIPDHT